MRTPPPDSAWTRALLLGGAVLLLGACTTLGPDHREPDVQWLERWQTAAHTPADGAPAQDPTELRTWWRRFDDPVLNLLVETARRENLSLRIAGLRILENRALQGIAGSALYPQLQQGTGSVNYVDTRQSGAGDRSQTTYQLGFNLGWELDFWGRFQRAIESADAAFFASQANQRDLQVLISAQVAELYLNHRVTESRIAITRKNVAIQKRSFEITEKKFRSGDESELDFQQARTQYLATLSSIPSLELSLRNIRNALCTLLGRPPGQLPELAAAGFTLPRIDTASARGIPAWLLSHRPDVRAAAWQVAAQSAQIGIAEADYYPAISLLGALGWSGTSLSGVPETGSLAVGPSLRWNLFDQGAIANNVRLQDARLQQLIESYQAAVLQAAREVDDAATSILKTAEQQEILNQSVDAAGRALDIANTRYREGYADFQRVLDAQRALFAQEEKQLLNRGSHFSATVSLYKALGVGWEPTPVQELIPETTRRQMSERSDWGELLTAPVPDAPAASEPPLNE
jgi:NodT family efflux transporter outer membrane factor (OMF) lipoprotein